MNQSKDQFPASYKSKALISEIKLSEMTPI
jgi:hypothetical protein